MRRKHQPVAMLFLPLAQMLNHPVQVVIEPGRHFLADPPDFFEVFVLHLLGFTISSRGVQITGISTPASWQAAVSAPVSAAFAKCRQFHVSRNCILCTAATARCKASFAALGGMNPVLSTDFATRSTFELISRTGKSRKTS